jgi:hypothetical protein
MHDRLDLYVCGIHENEKSQSICYASYEGKEIFSSHEDTPKEWRQGRGIGPALYATLWGIKEAFRLNFLHITVHHVFAGVGSWATRAWKANKVYTQKYQKEIKLYGIRDGINLHFNLIKTEHPIYAQMQRAGFVATGKIKPEPKDFPFQVDPFPIGPPKGALETSQLCPRCSDAGDFSQQVAMKSVNGTQLVCPTCHLHLPDHTKLSYANWRNCTNPRCKGPRCLEARLMLGDAHPNFTLYCSSCFTVYVDQPLTPYWAKLWTERAKKDAVELDDDILKGVVGLIKEKLEESKR